MDYLSAAKKVLEESRERRKNDVRVEPAVEPVKDHQFDWLLERFRNAGFTNPRIRYPG